MLFLLINYLGVVGGAITWVLLNAGYIIFEIPIMHLRLIRGDMWRWYIIGTGLPVVCCVIIGVMLKMVFPNNVTIVMKIAVLIVAFGSMFLICALVLPFSRNYLRRVISW
jgi:hypothetical protein